MTIMKIELKIKKNKNIKWEKLKKEKTNNKQQKLQKNKKRMTSVDKWFFHIISECKRNTKLGTMGWER